MKERIFQMKKSIRKFLVASVAIFMLVGMPIIADTYQSYYTQYGEVYSCDINETLIVDATGNIWSVHDTEFNKGETVKIKFYTNHTDYTREDDIIIEINKAE
jgi:hypothetical protein